jgi:hypothetical protein
MTSILLNVEMVHVEVEADVSGRRFDQTDAASLYFD